ncbi:MAG: hypothetical protein AB2A00_22945 [Myxococcota bacterium]
MLLGLPGGVQAEVASGAPGKDLPAELHARLRRHADITDVKIVYDEFHPLHGGDTIVLEGTRLSGLLTRHGQPREEVAATLTRAKLLQLATLLVEISACEQRTSERMPAMDESKARLQVSVAGRECGIWEWFNEMTSNRRMVRVQDLLLSFLPKVPCRFSSGAAAPDWICLRRLPEGSAVAFGLVGRRPSELQPTKNAREQVQAVLAMDLTWRLKADAEWNSGDGYAALRCAGSVAADISPSVPSMLKEYGRARDERTGLCYALWSISELEEQHLLAHLLMTSDAPECARYLGAERKVAVARILSPVPARQLRGPFDGRKEYWAVGYVRSFSPGGEQSNPPGR